MLYLCSNIIFDIIKENKNGTGSAGNTAGGKTR
jgi:hypothetical protein